MKIKFCKKAMIESWIAYLMIALIFMVICVGGYIYLKKTDSGAIAYIKNLFRFGMG